jgi:APA family basic amino acid/polyamine antiporter
VISTALYIAVGAIALGLTGATSLSSSRSPLADAIGKSGNQFAVDLILLGGLLATASVLLTSVLGVSRMAYAMARKHDLPLALSKVDVKHNTPYYSVWFAGILMALLVLFIDFSSVIAVSTFAMLFYYGSSNISALRLKKENRKYPQAIPAIGAITCVALLILILFLSPQAWVVGLAGLIAGAIYYSAKQRNVAKAKA